ncbi:unnamed protein product, partial [Heterotrigona itama]
METSTRINFQYEDQCCNKYVSQLLYLCIVTVLSLFGINAFLGIRLQYVWVLRAMRFDGEEL